MTEPEEQAIAKVVALAKVKQGAPSSIGDFLWKICAENAILRKPSGSEEEHAQVCFQKACAAAAKDVDDETGGEITPPPIAETAASNLRDDTTEAKNKKRKFDDEILPQKLHYGHFVRVPSYLAFVEGLCQEKPLQPITKQILGENPEGWCPKTNIASSSKPKENPRSMNLSRALAMELKDENVSVGHQVPILPDGKTADKQDVDVGIFVHDLSDPTTAHIGVVIEYKLAPGTFESYESQASAYGTDYMNVSKRSIIVAQIHGGFNTNLDLHIRTFGITPDEKKGFLKAFLFEGQGENAVQKFVAGLKPFFESFRLEKEQKWAAHRLSNVTALHVPIGPASPFVVKAYDYRDGKTDENQRRVPNFELVQDFIDPKATLIELGDSLSIVKTKFYGRDKKQASWWFDAVPARGLGKILFELKELHKSGYVHGDVRLYNMLPHEGRLVDFDFTRKEGECYPSTLKSLPWDGSRAKEVDEAIVGSTIGICQMKKSHDLESMLYVLKLYEPQQIIESQSKDWWQSNIAACENHDNLFELAGPLSKLPDSFLVQLKNDPRDVTGNQVNVSHGKGTVFSEEVGSIFSSKVVWVHGPFPAGTGDVDIFSSKLKHKIRKGKKVIADGAYGRKDLPMISVSYSADNAEVRMFKRRAKARQESFFGKMKTFSILSNEFRHDMNKHRSVFEAVAVICQFQIEVVPLSHV